MAALENILDEIFVCCFLIVENNSYEDLLAVIKNRYPNLKPGSHIPPTYLRHSRRIAQFSTIFPLNMDRILSLEYVATADDVHIKYFHRRQSFACEVELSSTSQARWQSMPGTGYVSLINAHICRSVVPVRAGGHALCHWHMRTRL